MNLKNIKSIEQRLDIAIHNAKIEKQAYEGVIVESTTKKDMTVKHINQLEHLKADIMKGLKDE